LTGAAATLLRQRFSDPEEMARHLHVVENRVLLFFRDAALTLQGGARVLLDVSFTKTEQQVILRGKVLGGSMEGELRGLWLEFPDTHLAKIAGSISSRKQKRLACDALVQVRNAEHPLLGRLTDLSLGGARLSGVQGARAGDELAVRIISDNANWPSELGRAQVVRLGASEVGARFLRDDSASRMAITRLFGALQESWSKAPLVDHPPMCCQGGKMLEPPLPHRKGTSGRGAANSSGMLTNPGKPSSAGMAISPGKISSPGQQ
jgi:hypothetical protein